MRSPDPLMQFFKKKMDAQVVQLDPIRVVMVRHTGAYETLDATFEQLWSWVTAHGVPAERTIGIYWDNPDYVATAQLRSAACVEVPSDFQLPSTGGLNTELSTIAGGTYVTLRYVGPYEELASVWKDLTVSIERNLRRTISQNPAFEVYVNDPSDTDPKDLITELFMPIL